MMKYFKNYIILYSIIGLLFLTNIGSISYFFLKKIKCPICNETPTEELVVLKEDKKDNISKIHVDIKGYIKNPGVYEIEEGAIVNDIINLAGGLKKGAITDNINLGKKLVDEAVVIINSKAELNKKETCIEKKEENTPNNFAAIDTEVITENNPLNNQNNSTGKDNNGKISLNKASKEELMTLSGIGEKTAEKIIEYRQSQIFTSIEEIKNVNGIGDALFEKIKDNITI